MRGGERGSAPLLLLAGVLTFAAAMGVLVHRAVLRELALEGEALQGDRAGLVAESALVWFLQEGWRRPEKGLTVPGAFLGGPEEEARILVLNLGTAAPGAGAGEVWKLTLHGRIRGGGGAVWVQTREAYLQLPRDGEGGPPALRAWRIVR